MHYVGIDLGSRSHVVASIDETGAVIIKPTSFDEDQRGYATVLDLLGAPADTVIAMESTGHYGRNLIAALRWHGFGVAVINPLRTKRFAQEDLKRAKTDSVDALLLARFAAQKRLTPSDEHDTATLDLRELVRFHDRMELDHNNRVRQLHRLVSLTFPEFPRHVPVNGIRATMILREYPTAQALAGCSVETLAQYRCGAQRVGAARARALIEAAAVSIGRHDGAVYRLEARHLCDDLLTLRHRLDEIVADIVRRVQEHPVASLLTTIGGIGPLTAAQIVATVGDPARFRSAATFAAYVGVVPGTDQSGLRRPGHAPLSPIGHARLRRALWMPTIAAAAQGRNPWLAAYYTRLKAAGKPSKVALVAAMRKLLTAVYSVAKHRQPFTTKGSL